MAIVIAASMTMGATSGCGSPAAPAASTTSAAAAPAGGGTGMAAGAAKCAVAKAANPADSCCVVGTSMPSAGMPSPGLVGSHVITKCEVTPEVYDIEVYLEWDLDGDGEYEIVDHCSQWEVSDLGQYCTVATSCKPGYYEVKWNIQVTINGVEGSSSENGGDFRQKITYDDCKATRHT